MGNQQPKEKSVIATNNRSLENISDSELFNTNNDCVNSGNLIYKNIFSSNL